MSLLNYHALSGETLQAGVHTTLASTPDGLVPLILSELCQRAGDKGVVMVARDGAKALQLYKALPFFAPDMPILFLPGWDCMAYDRVSPSAGVVAQRLETLSALGQCRADNKPFILITTVNAVQQKLPPAEMIAAATLSIKAGQVIKMQDIIHVLENSGFIRTPTVRAQGEYAVRGGILDLFAPGQEAPLRLDFFGDTLESVRSFDAESQRTTGKVKSLSLTPMSEIILNEETIKRFRQTYSRHFGVASPDDTLYHAISEGRRSAGMEHWLPFFYETLSTIEDYTPDSVFVIDSLVDQALDEHWRDIVDHYEARAHSQNKALHSAPYHPVPPEALYREGAAFWQKLNIHPRIDITPCERDTLQNQGRSFDMGGREGRSFAPEREGRDVNIFEAVGAYLDDEHAEGRKTLIACWSEGSRDRLGQMLADHDVSSIRLAESWNDCVKADTQTVFLGVLPLERGVRTKTFTIVSEQDILGDRIVRSSGKRKKAADVLTEATSLASGDLVVHAEHGIGQFIGLRSIEAAGAPHDCLELEYAGGDRLYLPVENIELLTRYGSEAAGGVLDKLGGVAWQSRKAKLKKRIREIADKLIQIAASRALKTAPRLEAQDHSYDEFVARFPYDETEDQLAAIEAIFDDLSSGKPMDRLVCGDVGFGKTEVALRAAYMAAMSGKQVAVVVPTTLLARQHYKTFAERFAGFPLNIAQASRFVGNKALAETRKGLSEGTVDIVIGTHALLAKSISFKDLGLLIIDEEQHFGVTHKERLKELKTDVHVLTLSATPIPRTLQLALTGVRELSLIATPPVDRLAVRTFVAPFDAMTVRETLLREHFRGGQSFFVCPRVSDLDKIKEFLDSDVPEVKVALAHGQMAAGELDDIMTAFYEGQYDVLLSTTIVESGLDVPNANTLIVHKADMFGLAQLYQLRGRVGRSKTRAYALFTTSDKKLTSGAERRLQVLQSLDNLGAGFQLASHDLDIRGAGNLLGDEQSGHIREVGFELYQNMLEEAVASLKSGDLDVAEDKGSWSPTITTGMSVMIPEHYVGDLQLRLQLYKRLSGLDTLEDIQGFGAEMVDRFGPLPDEVEALLKTVYIKALCKRANVEKVDAGPKGAVIAFRGSSFPNPQGLVQFLSEQGSLAKVKPDHRVVVLREWPTPEDRLKGTAVLLNKLAKLAEF
jgi:transcription-repair coupling factor (superfamily II helicase)